MKESLQLLLLEAQVYKEDFERSLFRLNRFCERLILTQEEELNVFSQQIKADAQAMKSIEGLLENTGKALEKLIDISDVSEEKSASAEEASDESSCAQSPFAVFEELPSEENLQRHKGEISLEDSFAAGFAADICGDDFAAADDDNAPETDLSSSPQDDGCSFDEYASSVLSSFNDSGLIPPVRKPASQDSESQKTPSEADKKEEEQKVQCLSCGNMIKQTAAFCPRCGCRLSKPVEKEEASHNAFSHIIEEEKSQENSFEPFADFEPETVMPSDSDFVSTYRPIDPFAVETEYSKPMAYLIRESDNSKIPLNAEEFFIGRDPSRVNICIQGNSAVSRVHAKIFLSGNKYYITDCNSVNGVYVNNTHMDPTEIMELFDGSAIGISTEVFRFYREK